MSIQSRIESKLRDALTPKRLDVIDESHLHAGHGHDHGVAFDGSAGTHFRVKVVAEAFIGTTRLERHRRIHDILAEELKAGVHALAIEAAAPGDPSR